MGKILKLYLLMFVSKSCSWGICFEKKPKEFAVQTFQNISAVEVNCWYIKDAFVRFDQQIFEKKNIYIRREWLVAFACIQSSSQKVYHDKSASPSIKMQKFHIVQEWDSFWYADQLIYQARLFSCTQSSCSFWYWHILPSEAATGGVL